MIIVNKRSLHYFIYKLQATNRMHKLGHVFFLKRTTTEWRQKRSFSPYLSQFRGFFYNDIDNHCGRTEVTITSSIILLQSKNKYEDCENKAPLSTKFLMRLFKVSSVLIFDNHIRGHQMESGVGPVSGSSLHVVAS